MDLGERVAALVGGRVEREVGEGHQSRVFEIVDGPHGHLAAKVLDAAVHDRAEVEGSADVVAELAAGDERVCRPVPVAGRLIADLDHDGGAALVMVSEWAHGHPLDPGDPADSALMGRSLATLHASMREVDAAPLPRVAALRVVPVDPALGDQLLHGDVNHANLVLGATGGVRIFDLEDCGRGPALFDVANAVYMARFAAAVDASGGDTFEAPFVAGYAEGTGAPVDRDLLEHLVDVRVAALAVWLDDLAVAPVGIATTPEWHAVLRRFVRRHRSG